jgi:hypothetical protein
VVGEAGVGQGIGWRRERLRRDGRGAEPDGCRDGSGSGFVRV